MATWIETNEDMQWLREVHLPNLNFSYDGGSAMLWGNEDCPERIEVYYSRPALVTDKPRVFYLRKDGGYDEVQILRWAAGPGGRKRGAKNK